MHTSDSFRKNVIEANERDGYEIDVFIHTWDQIDHNTVSYREDGTTAPVRLSDEQTARVKEFYHPKELSIEPQRERAELLMTEKVGGKFKRSIRGCLNMAYTLARSSELRREYERRTGTKYDYVIVTRPDIIFHKELRIDDFLDSYRVFNLDEPQNALFHGVGLWGRPHKIEDDRLMAGTDLVFLGRPENINIATSIYDGFERNINPDDFYCMEVWLRSFWRDKGLAPFMIRFRHGPEFDVLKVPISNAGSRPKSFRSISRLARKVILSLLPYFLVQSSIRKLKKKLETSE